VRDCRVQLEKAFVLSSQKCRFDTGAVQGVRRLDKTHSCDSKKSIGRAVVAGLCAELKSFNT
jgi:hypothetical protein